METTDYAKQASDFIASTGLKITKQYQGHRSYFPDDKEQRAVWSITFSREDKSAHARWPLKPSYTFTFGQSIVDSYIIEDDEGYRTFPIKLKQWPWGINTKWPKSYAEALAKGKGKIGGRYSIRQAKQEPTDYDVLTCVEKTAPSTFEDFCSEYDYDTDSRKALDTFLKVQEQAAAMARLFTPDELERLAEIQ
jgi:hypothetical protein